MSATKGAVSPEAKDLRIGNWVGTEHGYGQIETIKTSFCSLRRRASEATYLMIEPIPLTPELLEKCGFVRKRNISFGEVLSFGITGDTPIVEIVMVNEGVYLCGSEFDYTEPEIKYLHSLQNLVFALTRQELQIEL